MKKRIRSIGLVLVGVATSVASAQDHVAKLAAQSPQEGDRFGTSVAVSGDVMVVGATLDNHVSANWAGGAYIFRGSGDTWNLEKKVVASTPTSLTFFGTHVAVSGDTVAVSSTTEVRLFEWNGSSWTNGPIYQSELMPAFGGYPVALDGEVLVIGSGFGAHVYRKINGAWTSEGILHGGTPGNQYAAAVAVIGDTVVVGAPSEISPNGSGAVYFYDFDGAQWGFQQKVSASSPQLTDSRFGEAIDIDGDVTVIGAPVPDTTTNPGPGAGYLFRRNGFGSWVEEQKINGAGFTVNSGSVRLGADVAICGDYAVLGQDSTQLLQGALVFHYEGGQWKEERWVSPPTGHWASAFANAVALDGQHLVVGSRLETGAFKYEGAAYVFDMSTYPGNPGTADRLPKILPPLTAGEPDGQWYVWNLPLANLQQPSPVFLMIGAGEASLPLGAGSLLVSGPHFLLGPIVNSGNGFGYFWIQVPAGTPPLSVHFQAILAASSSPTGIGAISASTKVVIDP